MNRYKKLGIPLETMKRSYMISDENDDTHGMVKSLFLVAKQLLDQEAGAVAIIHGSAHWVSLVGQQLIIVTSMDFTKEADRILMSESANAMPIWLLCATGAENVARRKQEAEEWLKNPVFYFADQNRLDEVALTFHCDDLIAETKDFIKALEEQEYLGQKIHDNQEANQSLEF